MLKSKYPLHFKHTVPLFDVAVHWIFCTDIVKTFEAAEFIDAIKTQYEIKECDGMVVDDDKGNFYIFYDVKELTPPLIAHELYHMVRSIYHFLGTKDEELGARLTEYLTEITYQLLKKSKIPIKTRTKDSMMVNLNQVIRGKTRLK